MDGNFPGQATRGQRILSLLFASSEPMTTMQIGARLAMSADAVYETIGSCREQAAFDRRKSLLHGRPYLYWTKGKDWSSWETQLVSTSVREQIADKRRDVQPHHHAAAKATIAANDERKAEYPWRHAHKYSRHELSLLERARLEAWANRNPVI